jgi:hypothetical protein
VGNPAGNVHRDLHKKASAKSRTAVAQNHGLQRIFGKIPTPMTFAEPTDRISRIKNATYANIVRPRPQENALRAEILCTVEPPVSCFSVS